MKRLLFQAVFLATGMIMGVYASGDVGLDLMCGALVAVCCAAVGEYASGSWLAMALIVMLDCGACLVPAWYLMLPIAAFNAASSSAVVDGSRFLQALVPRWLWLLPMTIVIFRSIGSHVPSDLSIIILMVLQTVLGFAAGLLCTRCANLAREVRRLQDSRRDQIRRLRSQIAENDEDRALAVRTATLAERTRIAREIHDNVGHMLTRAIMQTEAAHVVAQVAGQEQSAQRFCEIHDTVSEAMTLVRKAVHDLKDEGTDFASQIETAAHSMDGAGPLRVRLVNGIDSAPAAVSRCFATAIREALNNTVKHSQARNVSITLRDFPALWQLCVQDDGTVRRSSAEAVAMQFIRPNDSTGIGISDIEERLVRWEAPRFAGRITRVGACSYPSPSRRVLGNDATGERSALMHVAIADDDPIVCSSLSTILEATGTADVAWTANTGTDAVTQYEMDAPDVLLVDVQMPGMDGLQASEAILDAHPNARILILTTFADESYIAKALEIGTKGYLIKQDVSSVIPAVQAVMAGQVVMGAEVLSKLRVSPQSTTSDESSSVDRVVSHDDAQAVQGFRDPDSSGPSERFAGLTERELDVLELVAEGLDNREIASRLFLSEGTVRNRISDILAKTNISNRTKLAVEWLAWH